MSSFNRAIIMGNLGQDPELRYTQNQTPVASFSLATNKTWNDQQGNPQKRTDWHRIVVWGKQAENCSKYLAKGRSVLIEGEIQNTKWTDQQGIERYGNDINALKVQFVGGQNQGKAAPHPAEQTGGQPQQAQPQQGQPQQQQAQPAQADTPGLDDIPF